MYWSHLPYRKHYTHKDFTVSKSINKILSRSLREDLAKSWNIKWANKRTGWHSQDNSLPNMVCQNRIYHFKFFKDCIPHILLGQFLNTLSHKWLMTYIWLVFSCQPPPPHPFPPPTFSEISSTSRSSSYSSLQTCNSYMNMWKHVTQKHLVSFCHGGILCLHLQTGNLV